MDHSCVQSIINRNEACSLARRAGKEPRKERETKGGGARFLILGYHWRIIYHQSQFRPQRGALFGASPSSSRTIPRGAISSGTIAGSFSRPDFPPPPSYPFLFIPGCRAKDSVRGRLPKERETGCCKENESQRERD